MHIRFWGTRGSVAKPGAATCRYGGNTSCTELRTDTGTLVVLDCGTGAHALGQDLVGRNGRGSRGHLLISHTHWDHIQGFPFFAPLYVVGSEWDVYGPKGLTQSLRQALAGQMEHTYFPISIDQLRARIRYHDLVEGAFAIDDIRVSTRYLNHTPLTLGYRLEADGASVVYACDHEPYVRSAASGDIEVSGNDGMHAAFLEGADVVIHDAQYTAEEYPAKAGWGHSTPDYVVRVCRDAGVRTAVLTHHDPLRNDDSVDLMLHAARQRAAAMAPSMEVLAATEGSLLHIARPSPRVAVAPPAQFQATAPIDAAQHMREVLIHAPSGDIRQILMEAAILEGLPRPAVIEDANANVEISAERCSLVLVQHDPPLSDALEVVRRLRASEERSPLQVPLAVVTTDETLVQRANGDPTDWLVAPFSLGYARAKIRAWVLRVACRWVRARTPPDEVRRLASLHGLAILDTPPEECFDRITRIAAATFDVPIALVSLVDRDRQWFKSCLGLEERETSREAAFCAHAVQQRADVVVPDTLADDRFADNPLVTGNPGVRFYAGSPLILGDGSCIGTLCIIDRRPRGLGADELAVLHDLRDLALAQFEARVTKAPAAG